MTYSLVARDEGTGELGVAVQSHFFGVGLVVPWAEPGIGAVATQSVSEISYGPLGLELLAEGMSPRDALDALAAEDPGRELRQVAFVDARGRTATHTGALCVQARGERSGAGYSVQGNMLLDERVVDAVADAFEASEGRLVERLLVALEAGEAAGGDVRGSQSAALKVVGPEPSDTPWDHVVVDLRVDDHADPVGELRRLFGVHQTMALKDEMGVAIQSGEFEAVDRLLEVARKQMAGNPEPLFWTAIGLVHAGRVDDALPLLREVYSVRDEWRLLVRRLSSGAMLPDDPELIERLASA